MARGPRRPKSPERGAKLLEANSTRDRFLWAIEGAKFIVADIEGGTILISDAPTTPALFSSKDGAL